LTEEAKAGWGKGVSPGNKLKKRRKEMVVVDEVFAQMVRHMFTCASGTGLSLVFWVWKKTRRRLEALRLQA
jgi:hypothetical protein